MFHCFISLILSIYITLQSALPSLPTRFTAIVEANIINKNITWIMEEWYDQNASLAKRSFYYGNVIYTTFEDFNNNNDEIWTYTTTHEDPSNALSCKLESYENSRNIFRSDESSSGGLVSSAEWFQFGSNFSEHYLGKKVIRGINSEGWKRNATIIYNNSYGYTITEEYDLIYYFSLSSWNWFYSQERQIPVRVVLDGKRTTDYNNGSSVSIYDYLHNYDYVQFLEGDNTLSDELTFDIPDFYEQCNISSYCSYYNDTQSICTATKGPSLPDLSYSFSLTMEVSITGILPGFEDYSDMTSVSSFYYDWDNNRAHMIWRGFMDGYYENAFHQLELDNIEQRWMWFGDGNEYTPTTIDDNINYCSMSHINTNYSGWDYLIPVSKGHIVNPHKMWLFDDHKDDPQISDEIWMGYTEIRGIPAEKWKAYINVKVNGDEEDNFWTGPISIATNQQIIMNITVFWYFSSSNWTFGYDLDSGVQPLRVTFSGVYNVYNLSLSGDSYDLVDSYSIEQTGDVIGFLAETPHANYFSKPIFWRKECTTDIDEYCNIDQYMDEDVCDLGLDLPTLPAHHYYAVVEANDLINEITYIIKTWYNYDTNEYRNEIMYGDELIIQYDIIDSDKRWTWAHPINDTDSINYCALITYSSSLTDEQFSEANRSHIKSVTDLWTFGDKYNETYLGDHFIVRGIPTRSWHRESNISYAVNSTYSVGINYDAIYYFANHEWDYYNLLETADIPVRVVYHGIFDKPIPDGLGGTISGEFHTNWEIVSFLSGPEAFDEDDMSLIFESWYSQCDVTAYCDVYPNDEVCLESRGPSMPSLPYKFFLTMEGTVNIFDVDESNIYNETWVIEEWYDYDGNQAHIIFHDDPEWRGGAMHQLDLLDDEQKWFWYGNGYDNDDDGDEITNCAMSLTQSDFNGVDLFVTETNGHIASPSKWFRWNDSTTTSKDIWSGYDTVRGISAEKWVTQWSEYTEVPESPWFSAYAIQFDATATYYWSTSDANIPYSNWDNIPLRLQLDGTYTLYNWSDIDNAYNIFWTSNGISAYYDITIFNTPSEGDDLDSDYFEIPSLWRQKCSISDDYCSKYPLSEQCNPGPSLPDWPTAFSTTVSCGFTDKNYTLTIQEYFDYNNNRERLIFFPFVQGSDTQAENIINVPNPLLTNNYLQDGRAFWVWNDDNCYLERSEQVANSTRSPLNNYFFQSESREHVTPSSDLYIWIKNRTIQHYRGKESIRGIRCDRWDNIDYYSYLSDSQTQQVFQSVISTFFQSQEINILYTNYSIPVRILVAGYAKTINIITNEETDYREFSNYYDFTHFIPGIPDDIWFIPPSNTTCDVSLWCNDIDDIDDDDDDEYQYYQDLIQLCDDIDDEGLTETECYYSCGEIYDKSNCDDNNGLGAGWIVLILILFIFGIFIGYIVNAYRMKKTALHFQQFQDQQQDDTSL